MFEQRRQAIRHEGKRSRISSLRNELDATSSGCARPCCSQKPRREEPKTTGSKPRWLKRTSDWAMRWKAVTYWSQRERLTYQFHCPTPTLKSGSQVLRPFPIG